MKDKIATGTSDLLRQFIEMLVEEVVLNGEPFDLHKNWLRKYSEIEGVDSVALEKSITDFFEVAEEWKTTKSKASQIALPMLAKYCHVSDECLNRIMNANAVSTPRDAIELADDQLYPIRKNGEWGYMDRTGEIVFMVEAHHIDEVFDFKENLARITANLKGIRKGEGFIDKSGKVVIDPLFDRVQDFSNGRSIVSVNEQFGIIDNKGSWVMPSVYGKIPYNDSGFKQPFPNLFTHGTGLWDINGRRINLPFSVVSIGDYVSEGLLKIKGLLGTKKNNSEKWGFINEKGELVIEPRYDYVSSFHEGLCMVQNRRKYAFIDELAKKS